MLPKFTHYGHYEPWMRKKLPPSFLWIFLWVTNILHYIALKISSCVFPPTKFMISFLHFKREFLKKSFDFLNVYLLRGIDGNSSSLCLFTAKNCHRFCFYKHNTFMWTGWRPIRMCFMGLFSSPPCKGEVCETRVTGSFLVFNGRRNIKK